MFGKILITGTMELVTGTHIGTSNAFSAIGAVDSPIIRDAKTNLPIIPGSSLKGKLRTLLAKQYNTGMASAPKDDADCIIRLFGSSEKVGGRIPQGRVLFSDMVLSNKDELYANGVQSLTEVKFENSINRLTAVANPRQIERIIRGAKFELNLVYEANDEKIPEDMDVLATGLRLLEYDYIGGSGSRGYGRVQFSNLYAKKLIGDIDAETISRCNEILLRNE